MTSKEKRFCDEYLISLNASQAYLKVNPKGKHADVRGAQMLTQPEVKKYIADKLENVSEQLGLKAVDVIREIKEIAFADIKTYLSFDENGVTFKSSDDFDNLKSISEVSSTRTETGGGDKPVISNVNFKLKMYDKLNALEKLGKYFKLFVDRVEHSGEVVSEVKVTIVK